MFAFIYSLLQTKIREEVWQHAVFAPDRSSSQGISTHSLVEHYSFTINIEPKLCMVLLVPEQQRVQRAKRKGSFTRMIK